MMLQVSRLTAERSGRVLFEDLGFSLAAGSLLQVTGVNGSGKTTLLRILMGLYPDFEGDVEWDLDGPPVFLGHRPAISSRLTVEENLRWLSRLQDMNVDDDAIDRALSAVALLGYQETPCARLSAGQRRRVGLAVLYLSRNPCWVLDEPFSSLDAGGCREVEALLEAQIQRGGAVILTSHQALSRIRDIQYVALSS